MKTESDFRIWYERELRQAGAFCEYMCSMTRQGIPDEFVTHQGISSWQELKFVSNLPVRSGSGCLVKHRFTGPQRVFLREFAKRGGIGLGVVGRQAAGDLGPGKKPVVLVTFFKISEIDKDGDVSRAQLESGRTLTSGPDFGYRVLSMIKRLGEVDEGHDHGQLRLRGQ